MRGIDLLKKVLQILAALLLGLLLSIFFSVALGTTSISLREIWDILFHPFRALGGANEVIILKIRLPRVLLAAGVGAALSMAGAAFQGLLRNPLADPYIVGTSAGAALGAAFSIILNIRGSFLGMSFVPIFAFAGAIITMFVIYWLARVDSRVPVETFLLAGVVVGSFMWALVSFSLTIAREDLPKVVFWLMGSVADREWRDVLVLLPYLVIGGLILSAFAHHLNVMTLGEESAGHLGVAVEKVKIWIIVAASLVTAAAVSVSGLIGFVGLMIPHVVRMLVGPDHRVLIPASALGGAIFLVWADTAARLVVAPQEMPVGVITALLGAPFFCWLLRERKKRF
ncbi:MAG: iron chelate uptake ABC transporter family permease subunit [bacterium]